MEAGERVRVTAFVPQEWDQADRDCARAERSLLETYLGKIGRVESVDVTGCDLPYLVRFSDGCKVPMEEMRFSGREVEAL